jgi:hypothetical protein
METNSHSQLLTDHPHRAKGPEEGTEGSGQAKEGTQGRPRQWKEEDGGSCSDRYRRGQGG